METINKVLSYMSILEAGMGDAHEVVISKDDWRSLMTMIEAAYTNEIRKMGNHIYGWGEFYDKEITRLRSIIDPIMKCNREHGEAYESFKWRCSEAIKVAQNKMMEVQS